MTKQPKIFNTASKKWSEYNCIHSCKVSKNNLNGEIRIFIEKATLVRPYIVDSHMTEIKNLKRVPWLSPDFEIINEQKLVQTDHKFAENVKNKVH